MLQAVINGQSALRQGLMDEIGKLESRLNKRLDVLEIKVEENTSRLDKLGKQLAYLDDDAPTKEEFDSLEGRVVKVEKKIVSN